MRCGGPGLTREMETLNYSRALTLGPRRGRQAPRVIQRTVFTPKPTEDPAMKAPRERITTRRLMISAAVVATILGAVGFLHWLWLPLDEPTKALNHGVAVKHRVLLGGTGEFLSWNPHGQTLATSTTDFTHQDAILWDATTGKRQAVLPVGAQIYGLAWSPDGKTLATGSWDKTATLWNPETGKHQMTLRGHTGKIYDVAWSPNGKTLATGADDNLVILWDAHSGQARSTLKGHSTRVVDVGWSPDGKTLASGSDGSTLVWDLASEKPRATFSGGCPRWSPDGKNLATVIGNTAIVWDPNTATERAKLTGHADGIRCLDWSPDGKILATGSGDAGGFLRRSNPRSSSRPWLCRHPLGRDHIQGSVQTDRPSPPHRKPRLEPGRAQSRHGLVGCVGHHLGRANRNTCCHLARGHRRGDRQCGLEP